MLNDMVKFLINEIKMDKKFSEFVNKEFETNIHQIMNKFIPNAIITESFDLQLKEFMEKQVLVKEKITENQFQMDSKFLEYIEEKEKERILDNYLGLDPEKNKQIWKGVADAALNYYKQLPKYQKMLTDERWFPSSNVSPAELNQWLKIYETADSKKRSEFLSKIMISKCDEKFLRKILDKWKEDENIKKNHKMLNEFINRYIDGDVIGSIYIIMPQIESLLVNGFKLRGNVQHKTIKAKVKNKLNNINSKTENFMYEIAKDYLLNVYFKNFRHGKKNKLSRNSISHGAYYGEFSKEDSLRLILLYDLFFNLLRK